MMAEQCHGLQPGHRFSWPSVNRSSAAVNSGSREIHIIKYSVNFVFLYLLKYSVGGIFVLMSLGRSKAVLRTCDKN